MKENPGRIYVCKEYPITLRDEDGSRKTRINGTLYELDYDCVPDDEVYCGQGDYHRDYYWKEVL